MSTTVKMVRSATHCQGNVREFHSVWRVVITLDTVLRSILPGPQSIRENEGCQGIECPKAATWEVETRRAENRSQRQRDLNQTEWSFGEGQVGDNQPLHRRSQYEAIASSFCNCVIVSSVKSSLNTAPKCSILRSNNKKGIWGGV